MNILLSLLMAIGVVAVAFGFTVAIMYGTLYDERITLIAVIIVLIGLLWGVFYHAN